MLKTLLVLFGILFAGALSAKTLTKMNFPMNGNAFVMIGGANAVTHYAQLPPFESWATFQNTPQKFYSFTNTIELDQLESTALPVDFDYTLEVKGSLKYKVFGSTALVTNTVTLIINSNPLQKTSRRLDYYTYSNAYESEFNIQTVTLTTTQTGLAQNVLIEKVSKIVELNFGIEQTTFSKPVFATIPLLHNNCVDNTTNELIVSWTPVSFAEEYELEIAFKDNYSNDISTPLPASAISYDFRENSTRIVTKQNYYRIPLVYERGYLLYRVRAVGMGGTDWNKRIPCAWSALPTGNVDAFTNKYGPILSHVGDKINWQLSTTYSDEGKRKDVVQYYDGLYMSRQTVTGVSQAKNIFTQNVLDNSLERKRGMNEIQTEQISPEGNEVNMQTRGLEVSSARNTMSATAGVALPVFSPFGCTFYGSEKTKEIIAQEVIYDFNGRPALQILPVPAGIHKITYIKKLNKNLAGASYSWKDFDLINNCLLTAHPLSDDATGNALGAGAYYSPKNPNKLGYNAFIPDSKGYPFSRVQYTFDNTGRTYRQADVGIVHELDIPNLVGHETKYYYAKPNQVELDRMFGNEVGYAIRYQKNMVVDPNGQVSVSYLNQEGKTIATALTGLKPDNLLVPDNESNPEVTINVDLMASNTPDSLEHSLTVNEQFVVADEAEYKFDYSVNGQKLSYNYCTNNNICLDCIYDLEIKLISNEGCSTIPIFSYSGTFGDLVNPNMPNQLNMDLSCADTSTLPNPNKLASPFTKTLPVGSYTLVKTLKVNKSAADAYVKLVFQDTCQSVLQNFLNDEISKIDTTGCYESCSTCQESNSDSLQKCVELCPEPMNECDRARYMMLLDVSPGGQYGQYDITTINGVTVYDASNYPLSVFNPGNSLPSHIDWRTIAGLHPTGTPVPSLDSIIVNWNKLTFPTLFLPYHPERCMLDWCDTKNTGKDYDLKLALSATDSASHAANLLSTTSTDPAYKQLLMNDPFFHSSPGVLTASGNEFLLFLTAPCGSTGLSVLEMAMDAAYCQSQSGTQNIINNAQTAVQVSNTVTNPPTPPCTIPPGYHTSHTFGSDPITKDLEWRMLRDFYRSYKEKYLYESRRDYSIDNGCFNGCIGVQNFWFTPVSLTGFNNTFPNFFGTVTHDGNSWSAEGHIPINSADPCGNTRALYESKVKRFTNRYDAFSHTSTDTPINLASINLYDPCATEANINAIQPQVGAIVSQYICDTSDTETSTEKPGTCWLNDFTTMLNQYLPSVTAGHIVYLSSGQIASSLKNFMYATSSFTPNQMALEYDSTNHVYIITIGGATGKCTFRFPARIHIYQLTPSYSISVLIPPTSVCCAYSTNALEVHFTMKYSDGTTLDVTATTQCPLKICAQPGIGLTHDSCTTRTSFALELFSFLAILKEPGTPLSGLYHNDGNSHQIDHMMDPNGPVLYSLNRKNCSLTFSPTSVRSSDTDNTRSNVQPKLIEQLRVRVDASGTEQARSSVQPNVIEQSRVSAEPGSTEELKKIVEAKGTVQSESTASLRSTTLITADIRKQNEENLQARQKVLDPCTIKFSDCDWMSSDATLISIQPYFENGIANEVTHEFIITYCKGSKPDTLTVRGNSGCFPIND
ncbi:MAG: hypothetical protein M0P61_04710, partial [Ignavibacteriaceae bacterium]|nr:hypothetical protein [Ignavibacteriaceae bacterium]